MGPFACASEECAVDLGSLSCGPSVLSVLDMLTVATALLNSNRQIVYANDALLSLTAPGPNSPLGMRPGEALGCIHASETDGGCGTTQSCGVCGAVRAILESQRGEECVEECRILKGDGTAIDLRVAAKPFHFEGRALSLFTVYDIGHEKRRRALERIFFHDIINTAGNIFNLSEMVLEGPQSDDPGNMQLLHFLSNQLLEEISAQKDLCSAESNELTVRVTSIRSLGLIQQMGDRYGHPEKRNVVVDERSEDVLFRSDLVLLRRVIANLVKNAVEASKRDDTVMVGCRGTAKGVEFWIHNPAVMTVETKCQIFQRSFSTKGADRGLGTYGAKLLTERFLKGHLSFQSLPGQGTLFTAAYPMDLSL
jgi:hypothetical protein